MKFVINATLTLCLLCTIAIAQKDKPKAAVYIMGSPEGRDALRMLVNNFLIKSGKYQMIAVDAIDIVTKEHERQMSGSVSDADVAKLGHDAGAAYVCVVEQTSYDGNTLISTRMVGVQSKIAELAEVAELEKGQKIIDVVQRQINSMLGISGENKGQTASAQTNKSSAETTVFTDPRNGKNYRAVKMGNKTWMAENLNYNTGSSWCYGNNSPNCKTYGRLYDWHAAKEACPAGWRLPNDSDWDDLIQAAGGSTAKLKSKAQWNGTDNFEFSALPGGFYKPADKSLMDDVAGFGGLRKSSADNNFNDIGKEGYWWSATENKNNRANSQRYNMSSSNQVNKSDDTKKKGYSVRCVKN